MLQCSLALYIRIMTGQKEPLAIVIMHLLQELPLLSTVKQSNLIPSNRAFCSKQPHFKQFLYISKMHVGTSRIIIANRSSVRCTAMHGPKALAVIVWMNMA